MPLPHGQPVPCFDFDSRGGGLGRDPACELYLPDPQRHVSRLQARLEREDQAWVLVDLGSNPTRVDGQPLGRGQRRALLGGERLVIGDYELEVLALTSGEPLAPPGPGPAVPVPADDPFAVFALTPPVQPASAPPGHPFLLSPSRLAPAASALPIEPAASDVLGLGMVLSWAPPDGPAPGPEPAPELLAALQRGLGQPLQPSTGLTPALLEQVGRLLREVIRPSTEPLHPQQSRAEGDVS